MGLYARTALAVLAAAAACQPARAMTQDHSSVSGVALLTLEDQDNRREVELKIEAWLDEGKRVAVTGPASLLGILRPAGVYAWPTTNTIVLDPGSGLGIFGFNATDSAHRQVVLRGWTWAESGEVDEPASRVPRSAGIPRRSLDVTFDLSAASPSSVCRAFRRKLASAVFGERLPVRDEFRAFASELRRWCQYGNLSVHAAALPQFTIAPFRGTDDPRLSLAAEWVLLRNDDPVEPAGTTFLFWAKTVGEGGGTGFGRRQGTEGYVDANSGGLRRLLDASIHSGWGPVEYDGVASAWPVNSSFPATGKTRLFLCDEPEGEELFGCPRGPRLRTLYPADSIDGVVTVARAERFIVGGNAQAGVSVDSTGKITPSMTFSLNLVQARTDTAQAEMHLLQTRSNADTVFHRITRWTPDVPAIYRWIKARGHEGSLAQATPLAATLNPQYEIVWEFPLRGNEGRKLSYNMIYEAGWNTCFNGPNCATHVQPPDRTLQVKARVGWKDRLRLVVPYD
jgi:hypothetical protein